MAGQILVPLRERDRIDEIIPYIEEIGKPGIRVIFLIRYPVKALWLRDHWIATESPKETMLAGRKIVERYAWRKRRQIAKRKIEMILQHFNRIFPLCDVLHQRGVEIDADVYTGSLRRVVESYMRNGDVHLIMMRVGSGHLIMRFLQSMISLFGLFERPNVPPVILLNPDHGI